MTVIERFALDLLFVALEHVRLTFGEHERDDIIGLLVGQVCDLQDSLTEYWRGELVLGEDDELPF